MLQREYEEFKIRVNGLVAKAQKIPDEGWVMQDGTPWPGNNTRDHPGMIQVCTSFGIKTAVSVPIVLHCCLNLVLITLLQSHCAVSL